MSLISNVRIKKCLNKMGYEKKVIRDIMSFTNEISIYFFIDDSKLDDNMIYEYKAFLTSPFSKYTVCLVDISREKRNLIVKFYNKLDEKGLDESSINFFRLLYNLSVYSDYSEFEIILNSIELHNYDINYIDELNNIFKDASKKYIKNKKLIKSTY